LKIRFEGALPLPGRYKYGFLLGGMSMAALFAVLVASPSMDAASPLAPALSPDRVVRGTFSRGLTLYDVLTGQSVSPQLAQKIADALRKAVNPRSLKATDAYEVILSPESAFQKLVLTRGLRQYVVSAAEGSLNVETLDIPLTAQDRFAGGVLRGSLWESMRSRGMSPELIMQFSDIFAWNVDFLTEPRDGDRFALLWKDEATPEGTVVSRRIEGALYDGRGAGRHMAFLHRGDYYTEDGESVRKAFLKAPLNFRRISSGFTHRRFHPVLRYFRPHLGIDYAAPTGTPVVSIGDGTVIHKGWKGMFGNTVMVRHNATYTTLYGHFSRFPRGLRAGSRVKQGQVVGYVGSTGHSTGPHLDFRIKQNGRWVNFLKLKFPADKKIPAAERPGFDELVREKRGLLEEALGG
jgi:murein DD-endopeptidase MepM/ murein hydrolase activator NlpD